MKYRLVVSYDCGISYATSMESDELDELVAEGKKLDAECLRWFVEDEHGDAIAVCRVVREIYQTILAIRQREGDSASGPCPVEVTRVAKGKATEVERFRCPACGSFYKTGAAAKRCHCAPATVARNAGNHLEPVSRMVSLYPEEPVREPVEQTA